MVNILFVFLVYHSYLIIPLVLFSIAARGMLLLRKAYRRPEPFTPPLMDLTLSLGDSDSDDDDDDEEEEEEEDLGSGKLGLGSVRYISIDVWAHATVPCRLHFSADTNPLYKANTDSMIKLDSGSVSGLAGVNGSSDGSIDTRESRPGINRSMSINSSNIIAETESGEETMDGAFSSYVQLRNSARKQSLGSKLRKINPVAIYKVCCQRTGTPFLSLPHLSTTARIRSRRRIKLNSSAPSLSRTSKVNLTP